MERKKLAYSSIACFLLFLSFGCKPLIALYDQYAYTQATAIKVDVLSVMDKATEPYTAHVKDIDDVNIKLMKNIEYEKHRDNNQITIAMYNIIWKLVNDPSNIPATNVKHGFFMEWQRRNVFADTTFIGQAKIQIGDGFDMIAELESKKIKQSDSQVKNFLNNDK